LTTDGGRLRAGPASVSQRYAVHGDGGRAADERVREAGLLGVLIDAEAGVTRRHEAPETVRVGRAPSDAGQPAQSVSEPATEPVAASHIDSVSCIDVSL